jgi:hypothetical protein
MLAISIWNRNRKPPYSGGFFRACLDLIGNTKTRTGLKIKAKLTRRKYPKGIKISNSEMAELNLVPADFHGDWNYSLLPRGN